MSVHQRWRERPNSPVEVINVRAVKREENETKQVAVRPDLVVDVISISAIRGREDNETRQMAVSPALVVVTAVFDYVSVRNHEESETKQMAAMPDLVLI